MTRTKGRLLTTALLTAVSGAAMLGASPVRAEDLNQRHCEYPLAANERLPAATCGQGLHDIGGSAAPAHRHHSTPYTS